MLAELGARLVIICRNRTKGRATLDELSGSGHMLIEADLERLADVRRAAEAVLNLDHPIHVLLNNAGLIRLRRTVTPDGFESMFAVNHLAHFLLTNMLLQRLSESGPSRIVNVSSDAHRFTGGRLDFDDLQAERRFRTFTQYGASKLCNLLFTRELARRVSPAEVTVNALHPGMVSTGLGADNGLLARVVWAAIRPFSRSPERGAESSVYLCSADEVAGKTGGYYYDCKPHRPADHAVNVDDAARLWEVSRRMTRL
jgi:NAD(P)-dependent dehydrogenase (short-subunit alcohol dehydrogenase family)